MLKWMTSFKIRKMREDHALCYVEEPQDKLFHKTVSAYTSQSLHYVCKGTYCRCSGCLCGPRLCPCPDEISYGGANPSLLPITFGAH